MLVGPSNKQLGLLAVFLDLARSVSRCVADISIVICGGTCKRGDVVSVERGCWFEGGGFAILLQLRRCEAAESWSKMTWGLSQSTCLSDMCLGAYIRHVYDPQSLVGNSVFFWILQWWRFGIFFGARLGDVGVGWLPMASVVAGNSRDRCVLF
jgi:hypothetical protein